MITLKKHYTLSTAVQFAGIAVIASANLKHKNGNNVFTPTGQYKLRNIGTITVAAGCVAHYAGHARVIGRFAKYISNKVGGSK